jgi:glycosyltransferase involved in cell wall biosynthesis
VPYKGHHHIVRAAALLIDEFPGLRVVLAGSEAPEYPDYLPSLRALIAQLGLEGRVELPGFVDDVGAVLERLTVFVNATYRDEEGFGLEGLSGAMLEAIWAGVPVVATRGGGTEEGLDEGRAGTLVEAAEPAILAQAIGAYLRDPELAARVGEAGKHFARSRFAPDVAARRLFEVIASVTAADGGRAASPGAR